MITSFLIETLRRVQLLGWSSEKIWLVNPLVLRSIGGVESIWRIAREGNFGGIAFSAESLSTRKRSTLAPLMPSSPKASASAPTPPMRTTPSSWCSVSASPPSPQIARPACFSLVIVVRNSTSSTIEMRLHRLPFQRTSRLGRRPISGIDSLLVLPKEDGAVGLDDGDGKGLLPTIEDEEGKGGAVPASPCPRRAGVWRF